MFVSFCSIYAKVLEGVIRGALEMVRPPGCNDEMHADGSADTDPDVGDSADCVGFAAGGRENRVEGHAGAIPGGGHASRR